MAEATGYKSYVRSLQIITRRINSSVINLAEATGFEPANGVNHYTLSKRAPSTTRPHFRLLGNFSTTPLSFQYAEYGGKSCKF